MSQPSTRTFLAVLAVLAVASMGAVSASVVAEPTGDSAHEPIIMESALATDRATESNLTVRSTADPPTPNTTATHYVTVTIPNESDGAPLRSLSLNYTESGVNLTGELNQVRAEIVRHPQTSNRTSQDLENATLTVDNGTVEFTFPGEPTLHAGDELQVAISGVRNPADEGRIDVGIQLNPESDGPTGTVELQIRTPAPTIHPQGVVGDTTRIAVHDPLGASGFIVAFGPDGSVLGIRDLNPDQDIRMDIGIENFVDNESAVENGETIRLAAFQDTNDNGEFDRGVDEQTVETTVEDVVIHGGTTTTTTSSTGESACPYLSFSTMVDGPIENETVYVDFGTDQGGFTGFIVVEQVDGPVLGTEYVALDGGLHADAFPIELDRVPEGEASVRVSAYRDTNRNGEFDRDVDEQCAESGEVMEEHFGGTTTVDTTPTTHVDDLGPAIPITFLGYPLVAVLVVGGIGYLLYRRRS